MSIVSTQRLAPSTKHRKTGWLTFGIERRRYYFLDSNSPSGLIAYRPDERKWRVYTVGRLRFEDQGVAFEDREEAERYCETIIRMTR